MYGSLSSAYLSHIHQQHFLCHILDESILTSNYKVDKNNFHLVATLEFCLLITLYGIFLVLSLLF